MPAEEKDDPIKWWIARKTTYPHLWRMALDLLSIPATSTPSERMFSRAGEMYSSRRSRLRGDAAQAILNLGGWWGRQCVPGTSAPIILHSDVFKRRALRIRVPIAWQKEDNEHFELELDYEDGDKSKWDDSLELIGADDN